MSLLRRVRRRELVPSTAEGANPLFPMSPVAGVGGWSLVGEEINWAYGFIPRFGQSNVGGNPYRDYADPFTVWNTALTAQANPGATTLNLQAPSDTTVTATNGNWTRDPTVASTAGWKPYDEWACPAAGVAASANGGGGPTSGTVMNGDLFIAPGALQPGQAVTYVNRLVPGMQLRLGNGGNGTSEEIVTIATVVDRFTVTLTAPLVGTWVNGTLVRRYLGYNCTLPVDSLKPGGSGPVLQILLPAGMHAGYASGWCAWNGVEAGNRLVHWDHTLCTGTIYVASWRRLSAGWGMLGGRIVGQKMFYIASKDTGNPNNGSIQHMMDYLETNDPGGARMLSQYQPQGPFDVGTTVPNTPENDTNDNEWHLMEMLVEPNTGGADDGRCRIWLDSHLGGGNLIPKIDNPNSTSFTAAQTRSFDHNDMVPILGGGQGTLTAAQWIRFGPTRIMVR
jgi:hypothetical protein